ncbi:MAG: hypothetical protein DMG51_04075 [Acidobacteria bacterium]|nr:MAG: hypothetical protein DMG51_04075 [Acidobacteriota bacterium]
MLRRQAYRFELRPSGRQLRNLRQFAGSCRFVYNQALALNTARYNKKRLGYARLYGLLPNWKREHPFLSEVPAQGTWSAPTPTSSRSARSSRSSGRKVNVRVSGCRKASR